MEQQFATSPQVSATTANARRKSASRVGKLWSLFAISILLVVGTAAGDTSAARYKHLGNRMICTCGCDQILLQCNHTRFGLGPCKTALRMRGELSLALLLGDKDDAILQSFAQKYGATVLARRSIKDVTKLAWIVGFAVFVATTSIVIMFVLKWRSRPVVTTPLADLQGIEMEALRRRIRAQTQNDDW